MSLQSEFLRAVSSAYPDDALAAGISLAFVPVKNMWYASICRYPSRETHERRVIATACSVYGIEHAWLLLLYSWTRKISTGHANNIKRKLRTKYESEIQEAVRKVA